MAERAVWSLGLMSGTSLDGIDIAAIRTDGETVFEHGASSVYPYEASFRNRLAEGLETAKAIRRREERPGALRQLEEALTMRHAEAVRRFLKDAGLKREQVGVVGFHGQTVLHRPDAALTVQIGDGKQLAEEIGLPVVFDMRAEDMREGGQGAPLVPAYHKALAVKLPPELAARPVVFVNIGGISNITYVDGAEDPIAFDTGPGNALIDQWVASEAGIPFDQDGIVASEGGVIAELAERYLGLPFFDKPSPKSLDRFDFLPPERGEGAMADVARTLCFVSAEAVLKAARHLPKEPKLWIVCGGGRRHPSIMADLREGAERLGGRAVTAEEAGLDGDTIEAEAWAFLAVRSLRRLPLTWPTTTGCRRAVSGGLLARPGLG